MPGGAIQYMESRSSSNRFLKWLLIAAVSTIAVLMVIPLFSAPAKIPEALACASLFAAAFAVPIVLARKRTQLGMLWVAAYLIVYTSLTWQGEYIGGNFGGSDNRETWYPAYCGKTYQSLSGRQKSELTFLGCFYSPLIVLDRMLIHQTKMAN